MTRDPDECVRRGAELLDREAPDWWRTLVIPGTVRCGDCVVSRAFSSSGKWCGPVISRLLCCLSDYGFNAGDELEDAAVVAAWNRLVSARLAALENPVVVIPQPRRSLAPLLYATAISLLLLFLLG